MEHALDLSILPQPDDTTCGPTCLHAVYRFYDDPAHLSDIIAEVSTVPAGGTWAVYLAAHALRRGYKATIHSYNLHLFDPTWFTGRGVDIPARLREQRRHKPDPKLQAATDSYLEFFALGGRLRFQPLTTGLLRSYLQRGQPILTGLCSTYLYQCAREYNDDFDAIRGEPAEHFVVLGGYDRATRKVLVWDPLRDNPSFDGHRYAVPVGHVLGAVLLGALNLDASLLVIEPPPDR